MDEDQAIISVSGLTKSYGKVLAVKGIGLQVAPGRVLALLGPNGAGKTTVVRILSTLLKPDRGQVEIGGYDAVREPRKVQGLIGLAGQSASVDNRLTGTENLTMLGRLYRLSQKDARARARQLIEQFDLAAAANRPLKSYSGGMRRRLDLAASLILAPPILFLDEPTTGLDPMSRAVMWSAIRELVRSGTTVLLTTQYLEEADQLADEVAVMDDGRMIAKGTPAELKSRVGGTRFDVLASTDADFQRLRSLLPEGMTAAAEETRVISFNAEESGIDGLRRLEAIITGIIAADIAIDSYAVHQPSLDDAFLQLITHVASGAGGQEN